MKKGLLITLGVIVVVIFITYRFFVGNYNNMVNMDENVTEAWANVETRYQERADLIPNLVNTVKGYTDHESEVLIGVTEARAKASSITIDPSNLNADAIRNYHEAQGQVTSALSRLLVTVEKYPDLKANQNFLDLQHQLEGSENRISVERRRYNAAVKEYNKLIRHFPESIVANMNGFQIKPPFDAQEGTENAPTVDFKDN